MSGGLLLLIHVLPLRALEKDRALRHQHFLKLGNIGLKLTGGNALPDAQAGSGSGGLTGDHGLMEITEINLLMKMEYIIIILVRYSVTQA